MIFTDVENRKIDYVCVSIANMGDVYGMYVRSMIRRLGPYSIAFVAKNTRIRRG